jgi:hypothetical protein
MKKATTMAGILPTPTKEQCEQMMSAATLTRLLERIEDANCEFERANLMIALFRSQLRDFINTGLVIYGATFEVINARLFNAIERETVALAELTEAQEAAKQHLERATCCPTMCI